MEILGLITLVVFLTAIVLLTVQVFKLRNTNKKLALDVLQSDLDRELLYNKVVELLAEKDSKTIEQSDGFLKFISDSRDWAYQYIETVQGELKKFKVAVEPTLKYINTYGQTVDSPLLPMVKTISDAYDELSKMLPEDGEG
jgi:hypothetical protein